MDSIEILKMLNQTADSTNMMEIVKGVISLGEKYVQMEDPEDLDKLVLATQILSIKHVKEKARKQGRNLDIEKDVAESLKIRDMIKKANQN